MTDAKSLFWLKCLIVFGLLILLVLWLTWAPAKTHKGIIKFGAQVTVVLEPSMQNHDNPNLSHPRDLAFAPDAKGTELWVVNRGAPYQIIDGTYYPNQNAKCQWRYGGRSTPPENSRFWPSFTVIKGLGTTKQVAENSVDPWAIHFLAEASSIAFGTQIFSPHYRGPSELVDKQGHYSFATCGESRNEMKGCVDWSKGQWETSTPLDFQGPTLWTTDTDVFAKKNAVADLYLAKSFCKGSEDPECIEKYTQPVCTEKNKPACEIGDQGKAFTLGSHLDMLHESPLCMGIAWEQRNTYWVFDGCGGSQAYVQAGKAPDLEKLLVNGHGEDFNLLQANLGENSADDKPLPRAACKENGDIVRYDFRVDHGAGFDDHCDGIIERYAIGKVKRKEGVPSHMLVWKGHLFIADTGNHRIGRLDPQQAGGRASYNKKPLSERVNDACTVVWDMRNATSEDIVVNYFKPTDLSGFDSPSGMAIMPKSALPIQHSANNSGKDILIVGDNASSKLFFISLEEDPGISGKLLGTVDLQTHIAAGGLMGLAVHPLTHDIYVTDAVSNKILAIKLKGN